MEREQVGSGDTEWRREREKRGWEKFWDFVSKITAASVIAFMLWQLTIRDRVGTNEMQISILSAELSELKNDSSMSEVKRDIRLLLDRTARIETKMDTIDRRDRP